MFFVGIFCVATLLLPMPSASQPSIGPFVPFGLQSGNNFEEESSYATSMVYNEHNREVIVTGGTYGDYFDHNIGSSVTTSGRAKRQDADCFVALFRLPNFQDSIVNMDSGKFEWVRRRQFGTPSSAEFCSGIQAGRSGLFAIGHSDENGVLSPLLPYGNSRRSIYGMILDLNDDVELKGGRLLHSSEVQYPVQMTSDPISQDLFVATIFSDAEPANILRESPTNSRIYPGGQDLATTGYRTPQYGRRFSVRLQRMSPSSQPESGGGDKELTETMNPTWTREFGTRSLDTVQVSSLVHLSSSILVMAGYTRGSGPSFGYAENDDDSTLDGFLTTLNPESGDIIGTKRISSLMPHGDDRILGLCIQKGATDSAVFVVGMTNGFFDETYLPHDYGYNDGSNFAFLMKIDLKDMGILWSRQLGAVTTEKSKIDHTPQVHGMACSVTNDGQHVWMAGAVKNGDALSIHGVQAFASSGGDDIFVAQFRTEDGYLEFAKQHGTSEDDFLAEGNSIDTDGDGNLIVLGNTRGSLYREKANYGVADLFAMSIGRLTGEFVSPIEITGAKKAPIADGRDNSNTSEDDLVEGVDGSKLNKKNSRQSHALISVGVLFGLLILLVGLPLILERIRRREVLKVPIETETFDAVDMILEAGTMKGWQNLVAHGEFNRPAIEYGRNPAYDDGSMHSGLPWETVTFGEYSQKPQELQHTYDSRTAISSTSSLALEGDDDYKARARRDPLLSNDGPAQDDPYEEIYDLLNEASERLAHKRQSGYALQRVDLLNQASERLSRRTDTTQTGGSRSRRSLTLSTSKDEYSINSLDEIWGSEII